MTGYSFRFLLVVASLVLLLSPITVFADESPEYSASPSATKFANATCTLSVTRDNAHIAPQDVGFKAVSTVNGVAINEFRYDFGDGVISTGSGTMNHRFDQAGSFSVIVQPLFNELVQVNPCKVTIVLKANPNSTPVPTILPSPSPSPMVPVATVSGITTQPETGPSSIYWSSLIGLFAIWSGAQLWYQHNRQTIG